MSRRTALPLAMALALAGVLAWVTFFWSPVRTPRTGDPVLPAGGDFTLRSANGPFRLADQSGAVVWLYFGYTYCPDVCPTSLTLMAAALKELTDAERERVRAVFISVDPPRDTPQRLEEYVRYFHPAMVGLSGDPDAIARVAAAYGAVYRRADTGSAGGYLVDHSSQTAIIGPDGRLRALLPHGAPPEEYLRVTRGLLGAR